MLDHPPQVVEALDKVCTGMIDFFIATTRWFDGQESKAKSIKAKVLTASRWKHFKEDVATKVHGVEIHFKPVKQLIQFAMDESDIDEKNDRMLKDFRNWLSPGIDVGHDLDYFNQKKLDNTCGWVEKVPAICHVLEPRDLEPRFLWITGTKGCGKSIVAAQLISILQARFHVAYFFCKVQDGSKRTATSVLRSWAWQLLRYVGREKALQFNEPCEKGEFVTADHAMEIIGGLHNPQIPTWLVLDGLDECNEEDKEGLLRACKILAKKYMIAFISRREPSIEQGIGEASRNNSVHFQITKDSNRMDIDAYLSQKVREMSIANEDLSMELQKEIADTLSEGANGMFLWAHFVSQAVLKACRKGTINQVKEALYKQPKDIEDFYKSTLDVVREDTLWPQERWYKIFQWICFGYRPLTLTELRRAISVNLDESRYNPDEQVNDVGEMLLEKCGCFVEIDSEKQTVQLLHASVKEFLQAQVFHPELKLDTCTAHTYLARACLTYLSYDDRRPLEIDRGTSEEEAKYQYISHLQIKGNQFLVYASSHWYQHLAEVGVLESHRSECITSFRRFATSEVLILRWLQLCCCLDGKIVSQVPKVYPQNTLSLSQLVHGTELGELSRSNDFQLLSTHLELTKSGHSTRWQRINSQRKTTLRYPALLSVAIYFDFADFVEKEIETLREEVKNKRDQGLSPLSLAFSGGAVGTFQRLIKHKVLDLQGMDDTDVIALRLQNMSLGVLLTTDYKMNAEKRLGRRIMHGLLVDTPKDTPDRALMAREMIRRGFDITIMDDTARGIVSCLHIAIQKSMPRMVNSLLIEARVTFGNEKIQKFLDSIFERKMPAMRGLLKKTKSGHSWETLVRIASDANISALVDQGSALHVALLTMPDMVPSLLYPTVDLTAVDLNENQPLHLAAQLDIPDVIEALVEAGADVQACNLHGDRPLDLARSDFARMLLHYPMA